MKTRKQQGKKLHKELDPGRREMRRAERQAHGQPTRRSPSPLYRERVENP